LKDLVESFVLINTKALHPIRITLPLYNYNHGEKAKGRRNHVVEVSFDGGAREWIDLALSSCAATEFGCLSSWCTAIPWWDKTCGQKILGYECRNSPFHFAAVNLNFWWGKHAL
jgi:hypothetical protein